MIENADFADSFEMIGVIAGPSVMRILIIEVIFLLQDYIISSNTGYLSKILHAKEETCLID
jgi:hypothetical protein